MPKSCLQAVVVQLPIKECLGDLLIKPVLNSGVRSEAVHAGGQNGRRRIHAREQEQHEVRYEHRLDL